MDLVALRIFKAVAEQGGILRAASTLHRVQSNVTTRVQRLEARLGTKLFNREGRRLVLISQGKVLLAALPPQRLAEVLALPSRSGLTPHVVRPVEELEEELARVRARGWALADEELAPGVRSVAVPVRDGTGEVRAAMNVTVHAAETSTQRLTEEFLPQLRQTAAEVSEDWAVWQRRPHVEVVRRPAS